MEEELIRKQEALLHIDVMCYQCKRMFAFSYCIQYDGRNYCHHCSQTLPLLPVFEKPMTTEKSEEIDNVLTQLAGISRQKAAEKHICAWCKNPIMEFKDELSKKEHRISGLCQKCQDDTFGV